MQYLDNILFLVLLIAGFGLFFKSLKEIYRNIKLGREINRSDNPSERWKTMATVALGQSKMKKRPVAAFLHMIVYVGFVIINIELIEIIVDGIFGTHRFLASIFGDTLYGIFTATLEVLAALVVIAVVAFFIRRNGLKIPRLS
jgi:hypothetical protein